MSTDREDANPYVPPESGSRVPDDLGEVISPFRSALNIGCGVAGLMVMTPLTFVEFLDLLSGNAPLALAMSLLLTFGFAHSVFWAARRRRTSLPEPIVLDERRQREQEHRRMHGY